MSGQFLVATQLSSLALSSQATSIPLPTSRQDTPLPPSHQDSDPPLEHASFASTLHTAITGTIILRVLHAGLIIELISLSAEVPPIRFVFPAVVISSPAIFLWNSDELHVLAVTSTGSVYRLVLPAGRGRRLWQETLIGNWCREYIIKSNVGVMEGLVQVQGTHCIVLGLASGSLLRLETSYLGDSSHHDEWTETIFSSGSFLSAITSFLPSGGHPSGSEFVSIASHPWPTDVTHTWSLSRDRTLRLWKAKAGCVCAKTLPVTISGRASTPAPGTSALSTKPHLLLEAGSQRLLRVFSSNSEEDHIYALAFTPTPLSSTSGGFFQLFDTFEGQLHHIAAIECSKESTHCHLQDFLVFSNTLYTLWDRQGQSVVAKTSINPRKLSAESFDPPAWKIASYAAEAELTPAYLDELLLSPGSLTAKFLEAIMRPGMFSDLTLRYAIDQYTDACLSLPGHPPPQLTAAYPSTSENIAAVVGCTVNLMRESSTGALQHAQYWNALKRDWEGFIARCREIERSARWPLALGVEDPKGIVIIVERERVGSLVREDLPITLHRLLVSSTPPQEAQYALMEILWNLCDKLGRQMLLNLESRLIDIIHQEIAFSLVDIVQDQARRSKFREALEEGLESWTIGRLQSIEDLDAAVRTALDVIGGFDTEIKREEDEVELLIPPTHSDWLRALAATYAGTSIQARYDLCLGVVILLFFLADDIPQWDPTLLAEVFALYRSIAALRLVARQPAGEPAHTADHDDAADDVVARMRNMHMSRARTSGTTCALTHRLLAQSGDAQELPGAAHRFLDGTGLLQSTSLAYATKYEILFCERLRLLGYYDVAAELLAWLPRTPGVTYVLARLWLNVGRFDDASLLLEKLAGSFGSDSALSLDDQEALAAILPGAEQFDSEFSFYLHTASLFRMALLVRYEVQFSQMALSVAPPELETTALRYAITKGFIDLRLFDDAYACLIANPNEKQKRECVSHLVYKMCEEGAVGKMMTFNFAGFADEVHDALSFKSRNADPRVRPFYSNILYSWYISRGEYHNAARTMYQRVGKLGEIPADPATFVSLAQSQLDAYLLAMNSLSLIDQKDTWITLPVPLESGHEPRKRRKLSIHIPAASYAIGTQDIEIIDFAQIEYEYSLLSARLQFIRMDPTILSQGDPAAMVSLLLTPESLVLKFAHLSCFDLAFATACSLKVDMSDIFTHLTRQCLRLSGKSSGILYVTGQDISDWLLTDNVLSWPGTPAERGWRYLRRSLERHDGHETDHIYAKVTLETILALEGSQPPPPWLISSLEERHPEDLIRIDLRYGFLEYALEHTLSLVRKADTRVSRNPPKHASSTWLPYALIDQVLAASASAQDELSPRGKILHGDLQTAVSNRVKHMQRLS